VRHEPRRDAARLLVVTAVEAERDAIVRGLGHAGTAGTGGDGGQVVVIAGGVGVAAAAAAAPRTLVMAQLRERAFMVVMSAGIAGGFAGRADIGATVLGTRAVAADLGADSPEGFLGLDELGFGSSSAAADARACAALHRALPHAVLGEILTVSTVTGTRERGDELAQRHPVAVAEAMEGFGVASAAALAGTAFAELRTISNTIGARERAGWRIAEALAALELAGSVLATLDP
jgi:futalosine hydrolase